MLGPIHRKLKRRQQLQHAMTDATGTSYRVVCWKASASRGPGYGGISRQSQRLGAVHRTHVEICVCAKDTPLGDKALAPKSEISVYPEVAAKSSHGLRARLFQRRWRDSRVAHDLADALGMRDEQRDDRRLCIECAHYPSRQFGQWCRKRRAVIPLGILHRCPLFSFETP